MAIDIFRVSKNLHVDLCVCVCSKKAFSKKGLVEDLEKAFKAQPRQSIKSNIVSWG